MNQFLAACLVLPILLFFPMQFALQTVNHHKIVQFQSIVESAKEQAKQDGYFTADNIAKMKSEISTSFKTITGDEIILNVTQTPKYRIDTFDKRELISYEVGVPISELIAASELFGIAGENNKMTYYVSGEVASERLAI